MTSQKKQQKINQRMCYKIFLSLACIQVVDWTNYYGMIESKTKIFHLNQSTSSEWGNSGVFISARGENTHAHEIQYENTFELMHRKPFTITFYSFIIFTKFSLLLIIVVW